MKYKNTIDLKRAHADLRRTALAIAEKLGDRIVAIAQELAPVDTGYYKASIHATPAVGGNGLTIFISAPYALYDFVCIITEVILKRRFFDYEALFFCNKS